MLNMIIIEDDAIQCKQLVNFISSSVSDLKLYSMCFCGKEALQIIKDEKVDIIFLDLELPDISGMQILKFIEDNNLEKYKNSIIVVSGNTYLYPDLSHNPYIYAIIQKPVNSEILTKCLREVSNDKKHPTNESFIKLKINKELEYLCFNFSHIGTQYLCECIYLLYSNNKYDSNLSKDIYPVVAKKFSTTVNNVKCDIFQATNISYYECEEYKMKEYFCSFSSSKPKTKDVISEVLKHLDNNIHIKKERMPI